MFKKILVIDVLKRIPDFENKIKNFSHSSSIYADNIYDLEPTSKKEVDGILVSIYQDLSESFLSQFNNLHYIGVLGSSTQKIPMDYCRENNIVVTTVTNYCDHETAEWVMLKILEFFRNEEYPQSLFNKNLGVIGVGCVGKVLIDLALAFHMKVFFDATSPHKELLKLGLQKLNKEEIFSHCEVVSLHTPANVPVISIDILNKAKRELCLINTCMGRISLGSDLEEFISKRPDITLIMDQVASLSYQSLCDHALVSKAPAFLTIDSQKKLIEKFFSNMRSK
jgi:lactate dehydrogenase-like 2-hydroxyacid dehydrogenase